MRLPTFPDRFKSNPREAELQVWQGPRIIASSFKSIEGFVFKNFMNTIFNADYEGWNAAINGTGTPNFQNILYDVFTGSTKISLNTVWTIGSNKAAYTDMTNDYYVDIYADSISAIEDFEINDCTMFKDQTENIWRLVCRTGTTAVKRAKVIKTLFYGTNGSDPRASSTYITNITALKCSAATDVGKRAYLEKTTFDLDNVKGEVRRLGTFTEGSNTDINSWSRLVMGTYEGGGYVQSMQWNMPLFTELNREETGESNEIGTDTSGDDKDTQATCALLLATFDESAEGYGVAVVLTKKAITWSNNTQITQGTYEITNDISLDFFTDNSIPLFTQAAFADVLPYLISTAQATSFSQKVNGGFFIANYAEDATGDIHFDCSADNGSTWTRDVVPNTFFLFKQPGTNLKVRIRKTGSISDEANIYEYGLIASDYQTEE